MKSKNEYEIEMRDVKTGKGISIKKTKALYKKSKKQCPKCKDNLLILNEEYSWCKKCDLMFDSEEIKKFKKK